MIFQLPNGKVIHLTLDEYLDLTDEDIQTLMALNAGDYATSPWYGSSISKKKKRLTEEEEEDRTIDYIPEDDDKSHGDNPAGLEDEPLDDFPDIPVEPEF